LKGNQKTRKETKNIKTRKKERKKGWKINNK
jgi:hypothetical protein